MTDQRMVFVAGLHRSGTALLARCLAAHPPIAGLRRTGGAAVAGGTPGAGAGGTFNFSKTASLGLSDHSPIVAPF